jgi:hypothetical protein
MAVPKVIGCKPVGSQVLVEHLKAGRGDVQQSIVLDVGPAFNTETWGFKAGDRVMVVGSYNPVPKFKEDQEREMGIVEPHNVRAVLIQADE